MPTVTSNTSLYNVKDHGALGNNSHDDTASINATIALAAAAGGGTVYFPVGIYLISASLVMSRGVNLQGEGVPRGEPAQGQPGGSTTIRWFGPSGGTMVSLPGAIGGMKWEGICFDGNNLASTGWYFEALSNCLIQHCSIFGCTRYAIHFNPQVGGDNSAFNVFTALQIVCGSATGIQMDADPTGPNCCHNTFINTGIIHGNRALVCQWSDNNDFILLFCYANGGGNYDILLGPQSTANRFWHTEGSIEVQTPPVVDLRYANQVFGYDQTNGQKPPLIHPNGQLYYPFMKQYT